MKMQLMHMRRLDNVLLHRLVKKSAFGADFTL